MLRKVKLAFSWSNTIPSQRFLHLFKILINPTHCLQGWSGYNGTRWDLALDTIMDFGFDWPDISVLYQTNYSGTLPLKTLTSTLHCSFTKFPFLCIWTKGGKHDLYILISEIMTHCIELFFAKFQIFLVLFLWFFGIARSRFGLAQWANWSISVNLLLAWQAGFHWRLRLAINRKN